MNLHNRGWEGAWDNGIFSLILFTVWSANGLFKPEYDSQRFLTSEFHLYGWIIIEWWSFHI